MNKEEMIRIGKDLKQVSIRNIRLRRGWISASMQTALFLVVILLMELFSAVC